MKETFTDDADGLAGRGVGKEGRIGFSKDDDAGAGIQKQFERATRLGRESESEEGRGANIGDDLSVDEGAAVVG